ncbi:MAG: (2Fe-2S) ferredoxin domain-containing protein [Phormidesmis sp.]
MKILQGKYLKRIESAKGALKGIQLKTEKGLQVVAIPKALRAIAQSEISVGDEVRVWAMRPDKADQKKGLKSSAKQGQKLVALQLIPLAPKMKVVVPEGTDITDAKAIKRKGKKKKQAAKKVTIQLCQKKNCCKKGGDDLWLAFEKALQTSQNRAERPAFKLEAVGCLGGCKNGPNIRLLPQNVKHRNVKPSDIEAFIS